MTWFRINASAVKCIPISYADTKAGEFYLSFISMPLKDHVFYGVALEESPDKAYWDGIVIARGYSLGHSSMNSLSRMNLRMYPLNNKVEDKRESFIFKSSGGMDTRKFFKIVKINGASI